MSLPHAALGANGRADPSAGARPDMLDLRLSLALLAAVLLIALVTLALQGTWPKVLRVAAAGTAYCAVLLAAARGDPRRYAPFAAAGAACGLVSGVVRPAVDPRVVAVQLVAGALLLGGFHWFALRTWRALRGRLMPAS
jgi:hypothetical protein